MHAISKQEDMDNIAARQQLTDIYRMDGLLGQNKAPYQNKSSNKVSENPCRITEGRNATHPTFWKHHKPVSVKPGLTDAKVKERNLK